MRIEQSKQFKLDIIKAKKDAIDQENAEKARQD
jgi:hypothetical protein